MSENDKAKNVAERERAEEGGGRGAGGGEGRVGDVADGGSLEAEGRREQSHADLKDAGENVKKAARNAADAFDR